jgi:hypothetical protein
MRYLLSTLIALVISDGLISIFLVRHGLGREGNPLLESLVGEPNFMVIKVVGALLCAIIMWDIYKRQPKIAMISTTCFVVLYAGILFWNFLVLFITQV